ncbi:hypothetical protein [Comamonas sp. JC664]|uniref:hypothetical protein n=1 Tax=Comamonas sp. JC664 TaxID=2801917 RepID=UPI00188B627F|nr:hypothetical protein [Comamonas sp. JC664]GHG84363.1 hypothetical protein GCM10012319_39890 [Comamonas sp. KCTC 72670]
MFRWQQRASNQRLHVTATDANKDGLADALHDDASRREVEYASVVGSTGVSASRPESLNGAQVRRQPAWTLSLRTGT